MQAILSILCLLFTVWIDLFPPPLKEAHVEDTINTCQSRWTLRWVNDIERPPKLS